MSRHTQIHKISRHPRSLTQDETQVAAALLLLLLFRVLGSTAEDFFSPILTQLSQELGLPPRFAGGASLNCSGTYGAEGPC